MTRYSDCYLYCICSITQASWQRISLDHLPYSQVFDSLPEKYDPAKHDLPRMMHFGLPVVTKTLMDYAARNGLDKDYRDSCGNVTPGAIYAAVSALSERSQHALFPIQSYIVLGLETRHFILEFWNSYQNEGIQVDFDQAYVNNLVHTICLELELKELRPRWYFSALPDDDWV